METSNSVMRIILADDDADDRNIFSDALDDIKAETELQMFNDGASLMNYLNSSQVKLPHILFLDLNMPGKTGQQCLQEIRSDAKFYRMPVAIYSVSNSEKDIVDTLAAGANIYIHKTETISQLRRIIIHTLKINWQHQEAGLNRDLFFLNLS